MAEVLCAIEPDHPHYENGDIVCAFTDRRIQHQHAEAICHPWKAGLNADGLRPAGSLSESALQVLKQYRFERVSTTEVRRINQWTGDEKVIDGTPDADGEHIDVQEFLMRRKAARAPDGGPKAALFGSEGSEVWYGGRTDKNQSATDAVWDHIETATDVTRTDEDMTLWPFGRLETRHFLAIRTKSMTEIEAREMVQPKWKRDSNGDLVYDEDGNKIRLKKRKHYIVWRDLLGDLGVSEADVLDRTVEVGRSREVKINRTVRQSKTQPKQPKDIPGSK